MYTFWMGLSVCFYERNSSMDVDSKYLRYGEACILILFDDMKTYMVEAMKARGQDDQFLEPRFHNQIHDLLYNVIRVIEKFIREYRTNDPNMKEVVLRADLFGQQCKVLCNCKNRAHRIAWMNKTRPTH